MVIARISSMRSFKTATARVRFLALATVALTWTTDEIAAPKIITRMKVASMTSRRVRPCLELEWWWRWWRRVILLR